MNPGHNYKVLRAFGHEFHVLVSSEQTRRTSVSCRVFASPGTYVPLHIHRFEDEIFIVESGETRRDRSKIRSGISNPGFAGSDLRRITD